MDTLQMELELYNLEKELEDFNCGDDRLILKLEQIGMLSLKIIKLGGEIL